jgi:signal transduction histidine kinase
MVRGDADHLEQALLILLDNAFKYTPPPGEVRVATRRDGMHARIDVTDTGLGIPPEDRDRIFERFYRGRNVTAATGTGLGLAIASWIAPQHDGTSNCVAPEVKARASPFGCRSRQSWNRLTPRKTP